MSSNCEDVQHMLSVLKEALHDQRSPKQIGFILNDLLSDAGYIEEEIRIAAAAMAESNKNEMLEMELHAAIQSEMMLKDMGISQKPRT